MDLTIREKVRRGYTQDVLVKTLSRSAAEVLNTISDVAAGDICVLFQPHSYVQVSPNPNTREACTQPADMVDGAEAKLSPAAEGGAWSEGGQ